jgi:hypothetical protein
MKPSWAIRRRIIVATLLFCAFCVTYIMVWGDDRPVMEVIVFSAFGLALSVIGSYIFGAVWDDKNIMKELGPAAYIKQPDPLPGTTSTTTVSQTVDIDGPQT